MPDPDPLEALRPYFDLGHQGDFDWTQIDHHLAMTPTERLLHHERWRLFIKEFRIHAELPREDYPTPDRGES